MSGTEVIVPTEYGWPTRSYTDSNEGASGNTVERLVGNAPPSPCGPSMFASVILRARARRISWGAVLPEHG